MSVVLKSAFDQVTGAEARAGHDERTIVVACKHHRCRGTGKLTRTTALGDVGARCSPCQGTGEAAFAYRTAIARLIDSTTPLTSTPYWSTALTEYCSVVYGFGRLGESGETWRRSTFVETVLEHQANRAVADTVYRLGGAIKLFNWLYVEEHRLCPPGAENEEAP